MNSNEHTVQQLAVRYSRDLKTVNVPLENLGQLVKVPGMPPLRNPLTVIRRSLRDPISSLPLRTLARGKRDCCIVVSDQTRPVPNAFILPALISELNEAGMKDHQITILIANGTHEPVNQKHFIDLLGKEVVNSGVNIANHNAYVSKDLTYLGNVVYRTPVFVNTLYHNADLRVVTGLVEPHFMAGYSGGRKSICPGIVGIDTLKVFHGMKVLQHPKVRSCSLADNPVNQIACATADLAGCDFMLNVALNDKREITNVYAGDIREAHRRACIFISQYVQVKILRRTPIVITSGGGSPLDQNYYQTVKGMVEALGALEDGGVLVIASKCENGLGKVDFTELLFEFKQSSAGKFIEKYEDINNFRSDQWQVLELIKVLNRTHSIFLLSDLSESDSLLTRTRSISNLNQGLELALKIKGVRSLVNVIPEGAYVVPKLADNL